jgi:hypothetical protein
MNSDYQRIKDTTDIGRLIQRRSEGLETDLAVIESRPENYKGTGLSHGFDHELWIAPKTPEYNLIKLNKKLWDIGKAARAYAAFGFEKTWRHIYLGQAWFFDYEQQKNTLLFLFPAESEAQFAKVANLNNIAIKKSAQYHDTGSNLSRYRAKYFSWLNNIKK